jgi:PAS domain S-box-containing protein
MDTTPALDALLRHPRLAAYAFSAVPAWLWAADAPRMLWANAVGAAMFDGASPADLAKRSFEPRYAAAREVQRLRATLPVSGSVQLARLRGFSAGLGGVLTCASCRVALPRMIGDQAGAQVGILIAGMEPVRPTMLLAERASRMLTGDATLIFAPDGALLHAGRRAAAPLAGRATLGALDAADLAATALAEGRAEGMTALGPLVLERLGGGDAFVLFATLPEQPIESLHAGIVGDTPPPMSETAALASASPDADARASYLAAALQDAHIRLVERRHPLRFVWRMDSDTCFRIESGDFTALAGPQTAALLGRPWSEIAATLALDPHGQVLRALASRDTWSGITIAWPVDAAGVRLSVVLSGLPVLTREREFNGYRGFGVCRDVSAIAAAISARGELIAQDYGALEPWPAMESPITGARGELPEVETNGLRQEGDPHATGRSDVRPRLTIVPGAHNVVPLRASGPNDKRPTLSPVERSAFHEIARTLGARLEGAEAATFTPPQAASSGPIGADPPVPEEAETPVALPALERAVIERLPLAVLAYRGDELLLANRAFFEWTGYAELADVAAAGGLAALFTEPAPMPQDGSERCPQSVSLRAADGATLPVDVRLLSLPGNQGLMLLLTRHADRETPADIELSVARAQARELKSILDTATDGVLIVDANARVLAGNLSAEALFGYEGDELSGRLLSDLFAPESQRSASDYFEGLTRGGIAGLLNDGREVIGRVRQGGLIPLLMTMGRIAEEPAKFCAVFRDLTQWKRAEEDLLATRRAAEQASTAKSDFVAKISHELRTPLNTIIGFAELMMRERLGPLGNERYRTYLTDMHACGTQVIALLNDLLDLSKIETGRLELNFTRVDLNEVMQQCVAAMQPQANRERIIIRTALSQTMPAVVADAPSLRQILLNLLSNSIRFTNAGGQVIVSTALTDAGEAVMRVRDTGIGMSETQIANALEPFHQVEVNAPPPPSGSGLGLPLTKALTEANRANFRIKSAVNAGTLVEVVFPATRVLSE